MSRSSTLILLGALTILTPFSGLPVAFRSLLAVILGACILGIGFSIRAREAHKQASLGASSTSVPASPEPPTGVSPI